MAQCSIIHIHTQYQLGLLLGRDLLTCIRFVLGIDGSYVSKVEGIKVSPNKIKAYGYGDSCFIVGYASSS